MQPFELIQDFTPAGAYQWGTPVEQHAGMSGFRSAKSTNARRVAEGARLLADVLAGRTDPVLLNGREAGAKIAGEWAAGNTRRGYGGAAWEALWLTRYVDSFASSAYNHLGHVAVKVQLGGRT